MQSLSHILVTNHFFKNKKKKFKNLFAASLHHCSISFKGSEYITIILYASDFFVDGKHNSAFLDVWFHNFFFLLSAFLYRI